MTGSNAQKALTIERKVCPRESGRKANKNTLDVVGTTSCQVEEEMKTEIYCD